MSTNIKAAKQDRCVGCEMCVMECQRQLGRVGLEGSYIRILRNINNGETFEVSVDPRISDLDSSAILSTCPRGVFEEEKNGS